MKKALTVLFAMALLMGFAGLAVADDSWTGFISDASCAKDYEKSSAAKHVGCAKGCISRGGSWALAMKDSHVLLEIDGKMAESHLGKLIVVKGELDEETNIVKVSGVEMAKSE